MNHLRLPAPRGRGLSSDSRSGVATTLDATEKESKDRIVQQTDQDASQSRLSAVEMGYLVDDFAKALCTNKAARKFPLINRGTFVRTTAIDNLVSTFLLSHRFKKQVVSFGAGSDTRFFRLLQAHPHLAEELVYHEIDFPVISSQKVSAILKGNEAERMLSLIGRERITAVDEGAGLLRSTAYNIHPLDLRELKPGCEMPSGIDRSLPTLFLSECCLIYLGPEEADAILKWVTETFRGAVGIVLYEPIGGDDAFGKVMIQNLAARGIVLRTLKKYSTLSRQKMRLKMLGFGSGQEAVDVEFTYENWVESGEKERIASLQMLDEVEEWQLLARHYCIAWGWRGPEFEVWRSKFPLQAVKG